MLEQAFLFKFLFKDFSGWIIIIVLLATVNYTNQSSRNSYLNRCKQDKQSTAGITPCNPGDFLAVCEVQCMCVSSLAQSLE